MVLCEGPSDQSGVKSKTVEAVFNNFFNDAFFLKTMGLNGYEDKTLTAAKVVLFFWNNSGSLMGLIYLEQYSNSP